MADLYAVVGSSIPIGTIIQSVGPPDSTWLMCDGSVLAQASYPGYVAVAEDLHPLMWKDWDFVDVDQSTVGTTKYAIDNIGNVITVVGSGTTSWYSSDGGASWNTATNLVSGTYYFLTNNGSIFVTARYSSNAAYYSSDGNTWTSATLPVSTTWRYGSYAGGNFCVFSTAASANYAYSSDGITWSSGTCPWSGEAVILAYSDGSQHIVITEDTTYYGTHNVHYSSNGTTWTTGSTRFMHGSPGYSGADPVALLYANSEYYMFWGLYYDNWFLKFEGSDLRDPTDWVRYQTQPSDYVNNWSAMCPVYTGSHFVIPNSYTDGGVLVGKSMHNLTLNQVAFGDVIGTVHNGENWIVTVPTMLGWHSICRSTGVSYDTGTHFQLPMENVNTMDRVSLYIKMSE